MKKGNNTTAQTFSYEKTAINRWLKTEKNPNTDALKARCTKETVQKTISAFPNVSLISAAIEPAMEDRPESFHIVLSEAGYGTTPATINIFCPMDWNGRFLGCTGGGVRTLHLYEVMGRENRIAMPFNAISNGFATANTDGGVPGEAFAFGLDEEKHIVSPQKMELFRSEAIRQSHAEYDFIESADMPDFDPYSCVGLEAKDGIVSKENARIAKIIFDGPRTRDGHFLWYGFRPGTHFWSSGILGEPGGCYYKQLEDSSYIPVINTLAANYINSWLKRDMNYNWQNITYREFEELFYQSLRDMGCMECNNIDLYNASQCSAKILLTHAVNDDTIPSDGTLDYYKRVVARYGNESEVNRYLRLFLTPGGGHTDLVQPGLSLTMAEGMTAIMKWVENGEEPTVLSGLWYDFEQNAPILTGKISLYQFDGKNRCFDLAETPAYATRNTGSLASKDSRFNEDSTIKEIKADTEANEILNRHIGYLLENPAMASAEGMTIGKLRKFIPQQSIKAKITTCMEELFALKETNTSDTADMHHYYGSN